MRLAAVYLACLPLLAQTNAGAIAGAVKVAALNLATNVAQRATTNSSGIYSTPALEPGTYRLTLEKTGFQKLNRGPVRVESSSTVALDFSLTIGNAATSVFHHRSCMSGDAHVQFWEGLGVRFPGAA